MMNWLRKLLKAPTSEPVPLKDFPSLFWMETHLGFCGVVFSLWWLIVAQLLDLWSFSKGVGTGYIIVMIVFALFFGLTWISAILMGQFTTKIFNPTEDEKKPKAIEIFEQDARIGIFALSTIYAIICSVLIWATGGLDSPFVLFYVMIFTLTIPKNKFTRFWTFVSLFFIGCLGAALTGSTWAPPITRSELAAMHGTRANVFMLIVFTFASLVVPAFSVYLAAKKRQRYMNNPPSTQSMGSPPLQPS